MVFLPQLLSQAPFQTFQLPLLPSSHYSFFTLVKMKFLTLASVALLAGSAAAAPGTALRRERNRQRAAGRKGNPMIKSDGPAGIAAANSK